MNYFLFIFYFIVLSYGVTKIPFIKNSGLNNKLIIALFAIKILAGIAGGLVSHYLLHDITDISYYTSQGLVEYHNLMINPVLFFTDSLPTAYTNDTNIFFGNEHSFWNDLRNNIILKMIGVLNIFSRGNYYINSLFFNVISFFGCMALFKIYKHIYPTANWSIIIGCFLLPSTLYFTSIIGKDLMVFSALSLCFYSLYFGIKEKFTTKRIVLSIVAFLYILLTRNFVALLLLPFVLVYCIQVKQKISSLKMYGLFFLVTALVAMSIQWFPLKYNPLQIVVQKQQSFFKLGKANSQYTIDTLQPHILSFISAAPQAVRHAIFSPYPAEFNNIYLNGFAIEMIGYVLLFIAMLYCIFRTPFKVNEFVLFSILFSLTTLLFIGYITPNAGSLIRYRSIYLPFLIVPILCNIATSKK